MKKSIKEAVSFAPRRGFRFRKLDISYILGSAGTCNTLQKRVEWLEALLTWIRSNSTVAVNQLRTTGEQSEFPLVDSGHSQAKSIASVRIKFLLHLFNRQPEWRRDVSAVLIQLATELPATELFCDVGISGHGLFGQISGILIERYLPLNSGGDLDRLVTVLFPNESDADWVDSLSPVKIENLLSLIEGDHGRSVWDAFRRSYADAMLIMASQVAGSGNDREMRERLSIVDLPSSAFFRLLMAVQRLHPRLEGSAWVADKDLRELAELQEVIADCLTLTDQAFAYLEKNGVSVGLVFRFERIERLLKRLALMNDFLIAAAKGVPESGLSRLLAELIRASLDAHRLNRLFSGKIRLLSRRIVDHTGDSGEHYITYDRRGYFQMLQSAAGGGMLTVGTTVIKAAIGRFSLPPLLEAIVHSGNYAGSFLAMHFCHFTLATKQPSMTASTLARKLSDFSRGTDSDNMIALIRDAFRSQFAAAIGNVGAAIPMAALVTWLYQRLTDRQIFTETYAQKTLESLDPFTSMTIPFAVLTGVILWTASLCAGAIENWVALHQMSRRVEHVPILVSWLGAAKMQRIVNFSTSNLPGVAGSVVLGILLAMTPVMGVLTGLPLDVRHVTLSSSALSIASVTLGDQVDTQDVVRAALGVGLTGLMNFGVSFFLALVVASRAQNVRRGLLGLIAKRVFRIFLHSPLAFFWPTLKK